LCNGSSQCIDLDSTTSSKFSRHLIFPHLVFANNAVVGEFAKACEERLPSLCKLVKFVDLSVYSRNRCFRVIGSSKFARDSRLLPVTASSGRRGNGDHISISESDFKQSLVCHVLDSEDVLLFPSFLGTDSGSLPTCAAGNILVCSLKSESGKETGRLAPPQFAQVDKYILGMVSASGGAIYNVTYFATSMTLWYAIKGKYRYCGRIERHHRSNNVILVVNIGARTVHQRCFDPDCRSYISPSWTLPANALPADNAINFLGEESEEFEQALWNFASQTECEQNAGALDLSGGISDDTLLLIQDPPVAASLAK
jgi:DNA-directed primase/polymerase protein